MSTQKNSGNVTHIVGTAPAKRGRKPGTKQVRIDWEKAERLWRTGKYNKTQVAEKVGTSLSVLSVRFHKDRAKDPSRWQQDLTSEIGSAAQALLIQAGIKQTVESAKTAETIVAAAVVVRDVILEHRTDIKEARATSSDMLAELRTATNSKEQLRAMLAVATAEMTDAAAIAEAKEAFGRLIRLHGRVASLQKMTDAMMKLQTMERRAFNIPDEVAKDDNPIDALDDRQLQDEIDRLRAEVERTKPYQEPEQPAQRAA